MSGLPNEGLVTRINKMINRLASPEHVEATNPNLPGYFLYESNAHLLKTVPLLYRYKRAYQGKSQFCDFFCENIPRFFLEYASLFYLLPKGLTGGVGFAATTAGFAASHSLAASFCGGSPLAFGLIHGTFSTALLAFASPVLSCSAKPFQAPFANFKLDSLASACSRPFAGLFLANIALAYAYKFHTSDNSTLFLPSLAAAGAALYAFGAPCKALAPFLAVNFLFPLKVDRLMSPETAERKYHEAIEKVYSNTAERAYQ